MAPNAPIPGSPPPAGPTDAELMLAFRGGDARAFESLVQRHQPVFFRE